jgi:hypothetical protein
MTVAKELSKYKLDLVGVQVRWAPNQQANIHFSKGRRMRIKK